MKKFRLFVAALVATFFLGLGLFYRAQLTGDGSSVWARFGIEPSVELRENPPEPAEQTCEACNGAGWTKCFACAGGGNRGIGARCSRCQGSGSAGKCFRCGGTGKTNSRFFAPAFKKKIH